MGWQSLRRLTISRDSRGFQGLVLGTSVLLCLGIAFVFSVQPDCCAAVLILPRWLWIFPGVTLAALGLTRRRNRMASAALALWLIFTVLFMLELRTLFRWSKPAPNGNGDTVRVVSLNCSGFVDAAKEIGPLDADVVLIQETPLRPDLEKAATQIAGPEAEAYGGVDVSLVARGKITPVPVADKWSARFSRAHVQLASGLDVEVIVVRLLPYNIRIDLWSPDCWRTQYHIRQQQRQQLERIAQEIEKVPRDVPLIIGGDFNLPAGDKMFRILDVRVHDAFPKCGTGWGDTLVNDFPFVRIDQIWPDEHFQPLATRVQRTINTDHRMVICDLHPLDRH